MKTCICFALADPDCPVGKIHGNHPVGSRSLNGMLQYPQATHGFPSQAAQAVMGEQIQITSNTEIKATLEGIPYARPHWVEYFLNIAQAVATRATCDRKLVGAVIVDRNNRIVSTGYNGSPKGMPHCSGVDGIGHQLKEIDGRLGCVRTLHAESNALDDAGRRSEGGTIYITVMPCFRCAQRIVQHGIERVVYGEHYESQMTSLVEELFAQAGVELVQGC